MQIKIDVIKWRSRTKFHSPFFAIRIDYRSKVFIKIEVNRRAFELMTNGRKTLEGIKRADD